MEVDLYTNFYKKKNSTKRPTVGTGITTAVYTVNGYLKEPCSVMRPVISFQNQPIPFANPSPCTYCYIPHFARYYFVNDWKWVDGLWEMTLEEDVLATWKCDIGEQTEYILRTDSTTSDFNGAISDAMYPATTDFNIEQVAFQNPFENEVDNGCYIMGVINDSDLNAVGAVTYYVMSSAQFGDLKEYLFSPSALEEMGLMSSSTWTNPDITEELFKTMYNPYQYIVSCYWFPIPYSSVTGSAVTAIKFGWWTFHNLSAKRVTQNVGSFHDGVEQIPLHPQASSRGKYLNYAPYTKLTMYGKFGAIPVDTSYLEIGNYLIGVYSVDYVTGQCLYQLFVADNSAGTERKLIAKTEFLIGVPIQLAQIGRDYIGTAVNAIDAAKSGVTGAIAGGAVGGTIGAVLGAVAFGGRDIYNTLNSGMPQLQTSGINGSFIETELSTILIAIHYIVTDENISHKGRPLYAMRRIDTLSGFVLCADGDIDLDCYDNERDAVSQFMTTGFFWE